MPIHVEKRKGLYRLVDPDGKIVKNSAGTAVDGGGHNTRIKAIHQAQAIAVSKGGK